MVAASRWTEHRDATLRRMVGQGASDRTIAAELHVAGETVRYRRMALGLAPGQAHWWVPKEREPRRDLDGMPLPAGHLVTWGALTAGTLLAGEPYPAPRP